MKEIILLILIVSFFNLAVAIIIHNKEILIKLFDAIIDLFKMIKFFMGNNYFKKNKSGKKFLPKNKSDL
jgi:hypothetical protein